MVISRKHKFIYIGINKTGTTSIGLALRDYRNKYYQKYLRYKHRLINQDKPAFKHLPAIKARALVGNKTWEDYFTFTIVRNPWARTLSEYSGHRHTNDLSLQEGFTKWVLEGGNWLARENKMKDFVTDNDGNIIVDYIGKLENISEDMNKICDKIGVPRVYLGKVNASSESKPYREVYTEETRKIVTEWVGEDAEMFGYEF